MKKIKTIEVIRKKDKAKVVINEFDFDPKIYEKPKPKPKETTIKEEKEDA